MSHRVGADDSGARVRTLDHTNFSSHVSSGTSWFVMWHAPWCGHCRMLEPTFHAVAEALSDQDIVKLALINAIDNHGLARRYYVDAYPTLMMLSNGEVYRLSRKQPRTPKALEAYARGGFVETEPELAVLSWRFLIPFHMFVDTVDDFAAWAWGRLKPTVRQCSASLGAGIFCGTITLITLLGTCCCFAALCDGSGDDHDAPRPPKKYEMATAKVHRPRVKSPGAAPSHHHHQE